MISKETIQTKYKLLERAVLKGEITRDQFNLAAVKLDRQYNEIVNAGIEQQTLFADTDRQDALF